MGFTPTFQKSTRPDSAVTESTGFPYTAGYIQALLGLAEGDFQALAQQLGIEPYSQPGQPKLQVYTERDVDILRKAVVIRQKNAALLQSATEGLAPETMQAVATPRPITTAQTSTAPSATTAPTHNGMAMKKPAMAAQSAPVVTPQPLMESLVPLLSQLKSAMLDDVAKLMDDKLAGLDDVVVELIKAKTENDTLRKRLKEVSGKKDDLTFELSRFQHAGLGFYRKL